MEVRAEGCWLRFLLAFFCQCVLLYRPSRVLLSRDHWTLDDWRKEEDDEAEEKEERKNKKRGKRKNPWKLPVLVSSAKNPVTHPDRNRSKCFPLSTPLASFPHET